MSKPRIAVPPSNPTYLCYLTAVTPDIKEALSAARKLGAYALTKLHEHGEQSQIGDARSLYHEEGEYRFSCMTELPAIPTTISAVAPHMQRGKRRSLPRFLNSVTIYVLGQTVLRFSWMPEGYFWVTWFQRGTWEQHLLSQFEHLPDTGSAVSGMVRKQITNATNVPPPANDNSVEGGSHE